jgi:hypothetical protein
VPTSSKRSRSSKQHSAKRSFLLRYTQNPRSARRNLALSEERMSLHCYLSQRWCGAGLTILKSRSRLHLVICLNIKLLCQLCIFWTDRKKLKLSGTNISYIKTVCRRHVRTSLNQIWSSPGVLSILIDLYRSFSVQSVSFEPMERNWNYFAEILTIMRQSTCLCFHRSRSRFHTDILYQFKNFVSALFLLNRWYENISI